MWGFAALVAILYGIYRYQLLFKGFENVHKMFPGLPTLPILGNAHQASGTTRDLYVKGIEWCCKFRRSFYFWIGPFLFIAITEPHEVEAILNNTTHIRKAQIYDHLLPWIKRGLLTSFGEKWKKSRKLLTPAFHFGILDGFLEMFNKNGKVFCQVLEKKVGVPKFDVMDLVKMCALDNICETAMGVAINAQGNPSSDYVKAISTMLHITVERTIKFWLRFDCIFELTSMGRDQRNALKILHGFTGGVIKARMKQRKEEGNDGKLNKDDSGARRKTAFLDALLDSYDAGDLTLDEVQEEVDTFMFEGHDTITSALSFALYSLGDNQEIQNRAYQEQCEIFGDDADKDPTMDDLSRMKYLEMVVKETLRLYPSVVVFGRCVESDLKLDEYATIPAGAEAIILAPGVHRNIKFWPNSDVFDPERFSPENSMKRHPYAFIAFSAGPRNCIGMKFAMAEMKSFLSKVVRKFQINPCVPRTELQLALEVILQSTTGVPISVALRQKQ